MAGSARLKPSAGRRLLALAAAVLLLHAAALEWLSRRLDQAPALRPMAAPLLTRLLQPQAAPPPARPPARARPQRAAVSTIASPDLAPAAPAEAVATAPAPAEAASQPNGGEVVAASALQEPEVPEPADPVVPPAEASAAPMPDPTGPLAEPVGADRWPADTRLNYRLGGRFRSGDLHGSARVQWQRQGDRYETRVDIDVTLLASLVLTSQGEVAPHGLLPRAYEELRRSGPRGVRMGEETITLANGRSVPRPEGVQDTASQFVELSHRFATGQAALEVGGSVSFWMARPGAVDLWTYDIVAVETLHTPQLGAVEAYHLKPRPIANPRGNITAEMWFAPSLQFLPVRIRVNMGETYVDLLVEKIEQR
jgi:hypothetical protein